MIDIHTHILPRIDDGARNWQETIQLCQIAQEEGIEHLVATPHFIPGAYTRGIKEGPRLLEELKRKLKERGITLKLYLAAEIEPFPKMIQWIEGKRLPLYPSGKHILVESPMYSSPPWTEELLKDLIIAGFTPILAHPERSPILRTSLPQQLVEMGGELQLDAGSFLGFWGKEAQRWAWRLIEKGLVAYVASDSHRAGVRDARHLAKAYKALAKEKGEELAQKLTEENPLRVITS